MFDGALTLTRLGKLQRLKTLADQATGNQGNFCSCLHHDAIQDPALVASGLPLHVAFENDGIFRRLGNWLGYSGIDADIIALRIFGLAPIVIKRQALADLIAHEQRR